jgi:hypothetical protein
MPKDVDIDRLQRVEDILKDSYEIEEFWQRE